MAHRRFGADVIVLKESRLDTSSTLLMFAILVHGNNAKVLAELRSFNPTDTSSQRNEILGRRSAISVVEC